MPSLWIESAIADVLHRRGRYSHFIRICKTASDMNSTLRGRPALNLKLSDILSCVRRHGKVLTAARELHCSDSYIHVRLKRAGLSLRDVLEARSTEELLHDRQQPKD